MDFKTSQKIFSAARMGKYANACSGDKRKTMLLYRYNLRLCQRFCGVLNLFEVMLRNAINEHYKAYFSNPDWIVDQADVGKSLLRIFPNKVKGKSQSDIYKDLTLIREFRNRIAHHEPICFDGFGNISTDFARKHYQLISDYISYMGQHPNNVIQWTERPDEVLDKIDKL